MCIFLGRTLAMRLKNFLFVLSVMFLSFIYLVFSQSFLPNPNPAKFDIAKIKVAEISTRRMGYGAWEITGNITNRNTCTHNVALKILFYGPDNAVVGVVPGKVTNLSAGESRTFRFYTPADINPQVRHQAIILPSNQ